MIFSVAIIRKGLSISLNNPTKEILYQVTSTGIQFKCRSLIDTFGQRGTKAIGSIVTSTFATSFSNLN